MIYLLIFMLFFAPIFKFNNNTTEDVIWNTYYTSAMKGGAILCVILCHYMGRYGNGIRWFTPLGGIGVGIFLILSAYGLNESWSHKGYKHWWTKRILSVVLPYAIIQTCIYWPFHDLSAKEFVLDILCIRPKYMFGWYLSYLLCWYIIFYIVMRIKILEENKMVIFMIVSIIFLISTTGVRGEQSLSFTLGIFLSENKDSKKLNKKINLKTTCFFIGIGIAALAIKQLPCIRSSSYIIYNIVELMIKLPCALGMMMGIYIMSYILNFKYLCWLGSISYEIYILHGYILNVTPTCLIGSILFISGTILFSGIYCFLIKQLTRKLKQRLLI